MSGGEFVYKSVKLSFTKDEARLKGPDGLIAKADLETIKGVLTAAVPAIGMENCVKLGAAATALTVAGLAIPKIWNWATASGVKEGHVLQLAIAKDKEGEFAEKMEDGLLLAELQSKFKRLDLNRLEGLIGPDVKKQIGEQVVKTLKGVRIKSVQAANATESSTTIFRYKGGEHKLDASDALFYATEDREMVERFAKDKKEDDDPEVILVQVVGKELKKVFRERFRPKKLVEDIKKALKDEEGKDFELFLGESSDPIKSILTLEKAGITKDTILEAKLESPIQLK